MIGITNSVSETVTITQARPPRAFDRSPSDERDLILVNVNVQAAQAQSAVNSMAKKDNYRDTFLAYINLGFQDVVGNNQSNQDASAAILSERFVFLVRHDSSILWKCPFGNISYSQYLGEFFTVRLVLYQVKNIVHRLSVRQ